MKSFITLALALMTSVSFAVAEKVKIEGKLYVPQGYDDNDMVEVTIVGTLPNSCYRNPSYEIERNGNDYNLRMFAMYELNSNGCRDVSMAYTETVNFGMMYPGEYKLALVNKRNTLHKDLKIAHATSGLVDEFLYGNVTGVVEDEDSRVVELVGVNPVNCLEFDSMAAEVQDSLVVLRPKFKEVGTCENKPTPFKIKYEVPYLESQPKGVLLHVRVMNGSSLNYLYHNRL